jgi:hypothetical protein
MSNPNPIDDLLEEIKQQFKSQQPNRLVTRSWKDQSKYSNDQLKSGVLTIVFTNETLGADIYNSYFNFMALGRIYCGKDAEGIDVERAELAFIGELKTLVDSDEAVNITINDIKSSSQMEAPNGWFLAECLAGPVDLSQYADEDGPDVAEIWLGKAPDIGEGHELDYVQVFNDE